VDQYQEFCFDNADRLNKSKPKDAQKALIHIEAETGMTVPGLKE
jgi:hypothetical protein